MVPMWFDCVGSTHDLTVDLVRVALSGEDYEAVLDEALLTLNKALAGAIRQDKALLINIGMLAPDFRSVYTDQRLFPANKVFNF